MIILANTNKVSQPGSTPCIWICLRSALMVWKSEKKDVVMCDEVICSLLIFRLQHDGRTSDHTSSLNLHINVHIQATSSLLHSINLVHPQLTWKVVINLWQRCIYIIELALGVGLYNFAQGTYKTFLMSQLFSVTPPPTSPPFCSFLHVLSWQLTSATVHPRAHQVKSLWAQFMISHELIHTGLASGSGPEVLFLSLSHLFTLLLSPSVSSRWSVT